MGLLAPWYFKDLIGHNDIVDELKFFPIELINGDRLFESVCSLRASLKPSWVSVSQIYSNHDGAGASLYKNISTYKAISEALERWAFYSLAESELCKDYFFDEVPTTTGMASYPGLSCKRSREKAFLEAVERWAIHEFWRGKLPVRENQTNIANLEHFEIITNVKQVRVSLLVYNNDGQYSYAFSAEENIVESFNHSLIELARNIRIMTKYKSKPKKYFEFDDISDRRLMFFSTRDGYELFCSRIKNSPSSPSINPKLLCDKEVTGPWSKYTKIWRYLYADSYHSDESDHTLFMF